MAVAYLKMTVKEFYEMTPKEFFYAIRYYNKEQEQFAKLQYEVSRYMIRHMWNMQGRQLKKMLKDVKDVEKFPWENDINETANKAQTPEEMATALKMIFRSYQNRNKKKQGNQTKQQTNEHREPNSEYRRRRKAPSTES